MATKGKGAFIIIMKAHNYQFSFNLDQPSNQAAQQQSLFLLLSDIFPYLRVKSLTCVLQLFSLIPFIICALESTLVPFDEAHSSNFFLLIGQYLVKSSLFLRQGSQYQNHFGFKYFAAILALIEVTHLIGIILLGFSSWYYILDGTTFLALYILSFIDVNKFRTAELQQYQPEEKVVQNYDLLNLNDTIIKLKNKESSFVYESYTNKEFYIHNVNPKKQTKRTLSKYNKKTKSVTSIVDEPLNANDSEPLETKIFKLVLFHFLIYANVPLHEFSILLIAEVEIYFVMSTKAIKKFL